MGTLNLCLKEPEKMQKTRNQSDHPRQRKRPKTGKIQPNSNFAIFWQFLGVFSAQSDRIHPIQEYGTLDAAIQRGGDGSGGRAETISHI